MVSWQRNWQCFSRFFGKEAGDAFCSFSARLQCFHFGGLLFLRNRLHCFLRVVLSRTFMLGFLWLGSILATNRLSFELTKGRFFLLNAKSPCRASASSGRRYS